MAAIYFSLYSAQNHSRVLMRDTSTNTEVPLSPLGTRFNPPGWQRCGDSRNPESRGLNHPCCNNTCFSASLQPHIAHPGLKHHYRAVCWWHSAMGDVFQKGFMWATRCNPQSYIPATHHISSRRGLNPTSRCSNLYLN